MPHPFARAVICAFALLFVSACSTPAPVRLQVDNPIRVDGEVQSPNHINAAKGFLHNIGAGDLALIGLAEDLATRAKEEPGMVELAQRAFAGVNEEYFEQVFAEVYARHLSYSQLVELKKLSANDGVQRFFQALLQAELAGEPFDDEALMRQMNADEITEILVFAESDGGRALIQVQPEINRELLEVSGALGEALIRQYIQQQKALMLNNENAETQSNETMPTTRIQTL